MVVFDPVVNVRSEPLPHSGRYEYDALQETQLEHGEPVLVYERAGDWVRIEAPEQLEYTHHERWQGYPGWVRFTTLTSDLSHMHGLRRLDLPVDELRQTIVDYAKRHIGDPYLWGGRSKRDRSSTVVATGVDCSGLVNWAYRRAGWFVPRDAHEQYMRSRRIDPADLKPADLVFLARPSSPDRIIHVAIFAGDDRLLEAPFTGEKVRLITVRERLGMDLAELAGGAQAGEFIVYFGTFFPA